MQVKLKERRHLDADTNREKEKEMKYRCDITKSLMQEVRETAGQNKK